MLINPIIYAWSTRDHRVDWYRCESPALSILSSGRKVDFSSLLPETVGMGFAHC